MADLNKQWQIFDSTQYLITCRPNNMGPCAGVAAQGQEGASAPLKYHSAPLSKSNILQTLFETWALGIYPGYPPLDNTEFPSLQNSTNSK